MGKWDLAERHSVDDRHAGVQCIPQNEGRGQDYGRMGSLPFPAGYAVEVNPSSWTPTRRLLDSMSMVHTLNTHRVSLIVFILITTSSTLSIDDFSPEIFKHWTPQFRIPHGSLSCNRDWP
jgi:hypothetical protein